MNKRMWMVRSSSGQYFNEFQEKNFVALGWSELGPVSMDESKESVMARLASTSPNLKPGSVASGASQVLRFMHEVQIGDGVVTYDPGRRLYLVGEIASGVRFVRDACGGDLPRIRSVNWLREVSRDALSQALRNSLGSTMTLFEVPPLLAAELAADGGLSGTPPVAQTAEAQALDPTAVFRDQENQAIELIKDAVNGLDWSDMQELVAGILRAMGYKTQISPSGPDRGKDIVASPDGFGFENPRIVVEVKHRNSAMGAQEIRSFLGGRHKDDRGLYVSTGGFTKDAHYEAERASVATALWDLSDLVRALIENYESLDSQTKRLIPLRRVYWPV